MMKFISLETQKPVARAVAVAVILLMLVLLSMLQRVVNVPLLPHSWNMVLSNFLRLLILIKRPPFIFILFNFIIVYILLSSTFSFHLKFSKKPKPSSFDAPQPKLKPKHDFDETVTETVSFIPSYPQTNHVQSEVVSSWDQGDTWWCQIVDGEDKETASFQAPQGEVAGNNIDDGVDGKAASFHQVLRGRVGKNVDDGVDRRTTSLKVPSEVAGKSDEEEDKKNIRRVEVEGEEEEKAEGDDTLDATWKAIMEAKSKGSGPQLKKSASERRGGEKVKLARYQVELKKCRTFREAVEKRENGRGGGGGGGRGGGGWRRMEVVMTDHDELKKRADAFISRVNHDIRLQRRESDQRFLEMINRGL